MLTAAEMLRQERERQKITFQQIEKLTKIRKKNLEALERGDWHQFSSKIYIVGMIRSYGKFLKINEEKLLAVFRREYEQKEEMKFQKGIANKHLAPLAQSVFKVVTLVVILIFIAYFGYQLAVFLSPPKIIIISPTKNTFKREEKIELVGTVDKESIVTVNGERVYQNKENVFTISIPLIPGENHVTIEVVGANGRKTIVKKTFKKI